MPQRFWITKPLDSLTTPQILQESINQLLQLVNQKDPDAVAQVTRWRKTPSTRSCSPTCARSPT